MRNQLSSLSQSKSSISFFILFVSFLCSYVTQAQPQVDAIVAVVGDKIILDSDIEVQYQQAASQGAAGEEAKCQFLEQMLVQQMLVTHAILDSVEVTPEEVESELTSRFNYYISVLGSEAAFEEYFKKSVIQFKEDFREDIRDQLLARRKQSEITGKVTVTPYEVKQFFYSVPPDSLPYFNAEVEIGEIVIKPEMRAPVEAELKAQLNKLREEIINSDEEDAFSKAAATYSQEPGAAASEGRLGFKKRGELVPEYEAAAYRMSKGEISQIVETEFGFHLIKLLERRGELINTQHILLRPKFEQPDIERAKLRIDSIRTLIEDSVITFSRAVSRYSQDESSKLTGGMMVNPQSGTNIYEMDQLDPEIYFAVDTLKQGEFSKPIPGKDRSGQDQFRILFVKSKTKPHLANLDDDYHKIQTFVENIKQEEAMSKWLMKKVRETYVQIDPEYSECPLTSRWIR